MLLIDDILLFPIYGVVWLGRKLHDAAQEERASEAEAITAELSELYMMLATGKITEAEFDRQEKELLDRLEEIEKRDTHIEDEPDKQPGESEAVFDAREKELLGRLEKIEELSAANENKKNEQTVDRELDIDQE